MQEAPEVEKTQRLSTAALYTCPGGQCQGQLSVAGCAQKLCMENIQRIQERIPLVALGRQTPRQAAAVGARP